MAANLKACTARVNGNPGTTETFAEELIDLIKCVDVCVSFTGSSVVILHSIGFRCFFCVVDEFVISLSDSNAFLVRTL
jgi:hypothetical protein